jgi:hypothetical protein
MEKRARVAQRNAVPLFPRSVVGPNMRSARSYPSMLAMLSLSLVGR